MMVVDRLALVVWLRLLNNKKTGCHIINGIHDFSKKLPDYMKLTTKPYLTVIWI